MIALLILCAPAFAQTSSQFNYAEALQKSLFFYEAQRSGKLPRENRVSWRADSGLKDGADQNEDLTGGWYDAGDHVKFGFPMASSATLLAWSAFEYRAGFRDSRQMPHLVSNLRWIADYFMKASATPEQLWVQVGDGNADHSFWGAAEVLQMARPSFKVSASCPGSDVAAETAAALAASSLVFRMEGETSYAQKLVDRAESIYSFADRYRGKYSDCVTAARAFYASNNGFIDELAWGAAWLFRATNNPDYLAKAVKYYEQLPLEPGTQVRSFSWTHNWDDKSYGTYVLLTLLTDSQDYRPDIERWLDYWTTGYQGRRIRYTPGGLGWLDQWGSLRYAANTALLAMLYSDWLRLKNLDSERANRYRSFAERQINYMLGDNPRSASYVIGFGKQPPRNPHHRTAHGSWADDINVPKDSVHTLYGALVGGPDASDSYTDSRTDYVKNEVATDYNAAFTGALAAMYQRYGGTPLVDFPPVETPTRDELFVEASVNSRGSNYIEIAAYAGNQTAWPARVIDNVTLRYFFDLPSGDPGDISLSTAFNQCSQPAPPQLWTGPTYYIEISCGSIFPGGQQAYRKLTQFRLTSRSSRSPDSDWSFAGLTFPANGLVRTRNITLYENQRLVWGQEPPGGVPQPLRFLSPTDLPGAAVGERYQLGLLASGGTLPYTNWEVTNKSLPDGLTLDAATGLVAGIPRSSGTFSFSIRVTDSTRTTAEKQFNLTVVPPGPLTISTRSLRPAYIGAFYSADLDASGGIRPYRWAVVAGALPEGFSLSGNTITGTSQTAGDFEFTIELTDSGGSSSQRAFVLSVTVPDATQGLKILYRTGFTDATTNQSGVQFKIVNLGTTPVPLAELKVRYYFSLPNAKSFNLWCDYSTIGCAGIAGRFVDTGGGSYYLELTFSSENAVAPGGDGGEVQLRFAQDDWSSFDQSDDYSFDASKRTYTEWDHMTIYRNGLPVWGVPPA
ncbi:MAG: glycoside hydrolase family 9 protein [Acidobacteria bacterium]|nr:glycoside hydrolase family 9 protein [Acidobacteriota bacterium]